MVARGPRRYHPAPMGTTGEHEIGVRYAETDQMGVVYHANYLIYMEEGRTRLMEELGEPYDQLERKGWALVVRKAELRFRASARYGDRLLVRTRVDRVRGASVVFRYEVLRKGDSQLLAEGMTELACLDLHGPERRPTEIPEGVRRALES
jgi:acyl-CoA thioester hydrolase